MKHNRVFVSGCYDMLHSGHVAFFRQASQYGDLYVGIGSDATIQELKGRKTIYSEQERLYMVKSIRYVTDACINEGHGMMDFISSVDYFRPNIFVVNEDGSSPIKEQFCKERGIEYVVLKRIPDDGLVARSTTSLRTTQSGLPTRLDLAGTWIDQPYVSRLHPGWALTISLEPTFDIIERCGMSTSTRNVIKQLWPYELPDYDPAMLAKLCFCFENDPSRREDGGHISGAQDSIGICVPGLCRHYYNGTFWPEKIETHNDEETLQWLEQHIVITLMFPRRPGLNVTAGMNITEQGVAALAGAADATWQGIMERNLQAFAKGFADSFAAQIAMFPGMMAEGVQEHIDKYKNEARAWKMAGAGGGGFLAMVVDDAKAFCQAHPEVINIKIRRKGN
ncbi:MAG: adenylyltransferase/cytidyltransferase family protein [Bacteroidaceae bacterium]|nr:adenylyltransferase/cytidyltransferase family protein [Bacteroidaceae bacterium]